MAAPVQKLIDPETLEFLDRQREGDMQIVVDIGAEQKHIEFRYGHAERFNAWKSEELHIDRANFKETALLEKIHDEEEGSMVAHQNENSKTQLEMETDLQTFNSIMNEMKSLHALINHNKGAAERLKRAKLSLKERRDAVQQYLQRLEASQDKERKNLAETHARQLRTMTLSRNLALRQVEDAEIRIILSGQEFNTKTMAAEKYKVKQEDLKSAKLFRAKVLGLMVRNQKEIEQLREEHLLKLAHITRYCDREIEIIDETETLVVTHLAKEQQLEANLQLAYEKEEARVQTQLNMLRVQVDQHKFHQLAARSRRAFKREAKVLIIKKKREAVQRVIDFWVEEEEELKEHLVAIGCPTSGHEYEAKRKELLPAFPDVEALKRKLSDEDADSDNEEDDNSGSTGFDQHEVERQKVREMTILEGLKSQHRQQIKRLRTQHRKIREFTYGEQQKSLKAIQATQVIEVNALKEQQEKVMKSLEESQTNSEKQNEDSKHADDRLYALLPRVVADKMRSHQTVEPISYENVSVLMAEITTLNSITSKSTANQIVTLLNRMYSRMDGCLDKYEDVYKLEAIGDKYCVVAGVNKSDRSAKDNAYDIVDCALNFVEIVENMDMSDQVQDTIDIKIGVHTGSAIGGVTNPTNPKFSLFGETVTVSRILEQSSKKNAIHIGGTTFDLVRDRFDVDVSESIVVEGVDKKQKKLASYWVVGRKNAGASRKSSGRVAAQ